MQPGLIHFSHMLFSCYLQCDQFFSNIVCDIFFTVLGFVNGEFTVNPFPFLKVRVHEMKRRRR